MPTRYVAFLRAINVGGRVVPMSRLKQLFESVGLRRVETVLASGNVLFESGAAAATIERRVAAHLERALGFEVATFVRTPDEVADVLSRVPFEAAVREAAHALYVGLLHHAPEPHAARAVEALDHAAHRFAISDREVYWLALERQAGSKMSGGVIERALGQPATFRNVNTLVRLASR